MEDNLTKSNSVTNDQLKKLKLTRKSKVNLFIIISIVTLFALFFIMNVVIHTKLEAIEIKLYKSKKKFFFSFLFFDDIDKLINFKNIINIIFEILAGLEFLIVYINIIYLILHPFIGLKLIFIVNLSYFSLILLKIIIQAHRPLWELKIEKLNKEIDCKTDYASPSPWIFFICFFYFYSIISVQKLKKQKFKLTQRCLIFFFHFIIIFIIIIILEISLDVFFHQLIFSTTLGYILICLLLSKEKNVHHFIFQTLKNIYNTRKYKIKIFFYVIGLLIITLISSFFIDENDLNTIKQELKDCPTKLFGMQESLRNTGNIFGIVGAVWGASFTLEKNISKWWEKSPNIISILKIIIIILFNGLFIILKYFSFKYINENELNFVISIVLNFFQNFVSFGIIPLIFEKFGLIENKKRYKRDNKLKNINIEDEQIILFRTSIFKEEKEKSDDGFVVYDKEIKKNLINEEGKDKKNTKEEGIQQITGEENEENEIIYDKKKEDKEELYENSNLVENVQNLEDEEEEEYLYLEGIEEKDKIQKEE